MGTKPRKSLTTVAAATAIVGAALVAPMTTSAAQAATGDASPAPRAATCSSGLLPAEVLGKSGTLKAGAPTGVWFWHDGSRYHLRATHDQLKPASASTPEGTKTGARKIFRGSITSTGKISSVRGVKLEGSDSFAVSRPSRKKITFRFANYSRIDGLSFKASCKKSVTLKASVDGTPVQINIGKDPLVVPAENRAGTSSYQVVSSAPSPIGCPSGRLPESVIGSNGEVRNRPAGAWLWHDGNGFQFRVTHDQHETDGRGARKIFRGSITTTAKFSDVRLVKLEANDQLFVRRPTPNVITFELHNYTGVDGLRFKAGCGNVTLNVSVDGAPAQIHLGKTPTDVPLPAPPATESTFVVTRSA